MPVEVLHWQPQLGPQEALLRCPIHDALIGGARGGGKTDSLIGDVMSHAEQYGHDARGLFVRQTYDGFADLILRADELLLPLDVTATGNPKRTYRWPSGANLRLRAVTREADAHKWQGQGLTWVGVEEITQWPTPRTIDLLRACLRSAAGIPVFFRASGNPGGPGHNWVKARYVDPAPPYTPFYDEAQKTWRVFIPATLDDNKILQQNDPDYWSRVEAAANGREDLIKAWRWGLWDIVAGGMFDDLWKIPIHVIEPFPIPSCWYIDRAFDWGSSKPFSVGWWAESDGTRAPNGRTYPRGTLFRFAEWYGWNQKPNEGLKMLAVDVAKGIVELEKKFRDAKLITGAVKKGPADTSIFDVENGNCIAKDMAAHKVEWSEADKSPGSRKTGWEKMRTRLKACLETPMEEPGLFIFSNCRQFIRTVPVLPRDEKRDPDDVDSNSEDHVGDESRYRILDKRHEITPVKLAGF